MSTPTTTPWASRIVGHARVDPRTLLAHPLNHRRHPFSQRAALDAAIREVGFIRSVVVNQPSGRLLDGHLRVERAVQTGVAEIDVEYVDLTPEQELLALATLDAVGELATSDADAVRDLLAEMDREADDLSRLLLDLAVTGGQPLVDPPAPEPPPSPPTPPAEFPAFDDDIATDYQCPRCSYAWSGKPR